MNISRFLAPRLSKRSILLLLFAYLAMTTVLMVSAARPFESMAAHAEAEVVQTIDFQAPSMHIPAPPYIIVEPAN
jgi:hypothetical protein